MNRDQFEYDITVGRHTLLEGCRRNLTQKGRLRFWTLGARPGQHPAWYNAARPDLLCDAELLYRERGETPAPFLRLHFTGFTPEGESHEVDIDFERIPLYSANYQLTAVSLDGRAVTVVEQEED